MPISHVSGETARPRGVLQRRERANDRANVMNPRTFAAARGEGRRSAPAQRDTHGHNGRPLGIVVKLNVRSIRSTSGAQVAFCVGG